MDDDITRQALEMVMFIFIGTIKKKMNDLSLLLVPKIHNNHIVYIEAWYHI